MQQRNKRLWQGDGATLQSVSGVQQQPAASDQPLSSLFYMLLSIFSNVTQLFCCCQDTHKERIYDYFHFPTAENHQISVTLRWKISGQALHPPSLHCSLLCTRVWSCFLMSSGTSGAITLSPSVVTPSHMLQGFIDPASHVLSQFYSYVWINRTQS